MWILTTKHSRNCGMQPQCVQTAPATWVGTGPQKLWNIKAKKPFLRTQKRHVSFHSCANWVDVSYTRAACLLTTVCVLDRTFLYRPVNIDGWRSLEKDTCLSTLPSVSHTQTSVCCPSGQGPRSAPPHLTETENAGCGLSAVRLPLCQKTQYFVPSAWRVWREVGGRQWCPWKKSCGSQTHKYILEPWEECWSKPRHPLQTAAENLPVHGALCSSAHQPGWETACLCFLRLERTQDVVWYESQLPVCH